ncbi:MAG: cytochrome c-type biogenesis protein CcmH [Alphaproteobacteria bacterium]|nr:cytochrome c-type biogenesis protein CcmH [Rhodospirillales bacterium]MCW9046256.1 cytochrome c-type biogenesis protein CcmH [Alphaproteobacteria bacterium]
MMVRIFTIFALFLASTPAFAVNPDEVLSDPVLEVRARSISQNLRCLVCQNQSIDDSDADLAKDLRVLVRERLVVGDSDDEVINFVVDRYGDFVLLKPPFKGVTYALWFGPIFIFLITVFTGYRMLRRRKSEIAEQDETLTVKEKKELNSMHKEALN